jgi:hypothetical protein
LSFDLTPVDPAEGTTVRYRFALAPFAGRHGNERLLVVTFEGDFGKGSLGNRNGRFMGAIVRYATAAFDPAAVVLDLRGLSYDGHDSMIDPIDHSNVDQVEAAIVVSDACRDGLRWFLEEWTFDPDEWLFDDLDGAIGRVQDAYRERSEALGLLRARRVARHSRGPGWIPISTRRRARTGTSSSGTTWSQGSGKGATSRRWPETGSCCSRRRRRTRPGSPASSPTT